MKYFIVLTSALIFAYSCADKTDDAPLTDGGEQLAVNIPDTCRCETLAEDSAGHFYNEDSLFTGVCIYNYPGSEDTYMVKSILEGKLHGTVTYYDREGNVLVAEVYENGNKKRTGDGAPLTCNCSELEQAGAPGEQLKRSFLDEIPYTGKCIEKYPDSDQTYMEVNYKNGIKHGFTIFYDNMGNTMYMEKYEKGELLKIIHGEN